MFQFMEYACCSIVCPSREKALLNPFQWQGRLGHFVCASFLLRWTGRFQKTCWCRLVDTHCGLRAIRLCVNSSNEKVAHAIAGTTQNLSSSKRYCTHHADFLSTQDHATNLLENQIYNHTPQILSAIEIIDSCTKPTLLHFQQGMPSRRCGPIIGGGTFLPRGLRLLPNTNQLGRF